MDALDIRILRELAQPQPALPSRPGTAFSYRAIAKKLGVVDGTVRDRIEKMRAAGFMMSPKVFPHPALLGLQMGMFAMDVSPSLEKDDVIASLRLIDGMVVIQNHHGAFVGLVFVYEDGRSLDRKLELFKRTAGAKEGYFSRMLFQPCGVPLKPADWEVVSRLLNGAPSEPSEVAREVGMSTRTLRRKLGKMVRGGALFIQPNVSYGALQDAVPADVTVLYGPPEMRPDAEKEILRLLDAYMYWAGPSEQMGVFSCIIPNPSVATKLAGRIRQIQGVRMARVDLVDEHLDQMEVFADHVERHLQRIRRSEKPEAAEPPGAVP